MIATANHSMSTASRNVVVRNRLGLHARPAMTFVDEASKFTSDVKVGNGKQSVDGKSIMHMMMLAATQGTELEIKAEGEDAEQAVEELAALVESGFDED